MLWSFRAEVMLYNYDVQELTRITDFQSLYMYEK